MAVYSKNASLVAFFFQIEDIVADRPQKASICKKMGLGELVMTSIWKNSLISFFLSLWLAIQSWWITMSLHPKMRKPNCQVSRRVRQGGSSVTDTIQHRGSHAPGSSLDMPCVRTVCAVNRKVGCDVCTNPEDGTQELGSRITHVAQVCYSLISCGDNLTGFGIRRASRNNWVKWNWQIVLRCGILILLRLQIQKWSTKKSV